jgi:ABC-type dipeptide/oligopeptide/nickel transport system permease component
MISYIMRRLLWMIPTLLAMALITFSIMHLTPGSPLDPIADNANPLSPEAQRNMARQYGLDKPVWQQFLIFLGKAVQGNFGNSYVYKIALQIIKKPSRCPAPGIDGPGCRHRWRPGVGYCRSRQAEQRHRLFVR